MLYRITRSATTIILTLALVAPLLGVGAGATTQTLSLLVTEVSLRAEVSKNASGCPVTVNFTGHITAKGRGTVKYRFVRSDGATSGVRTLDFASSGSLPVTTTWTLGDATLLPTYEGWQAVKVLSPNELESNHADGAFVISCGGAGQGSARPKDPAPAPTGEKQPDPVKPRPNSEGSVSPFAREAEVRLDRLVYADGETLSATVTATRELVTKETLQVVVASPETKDVEVLQLSPTADADTYATDGRLQVEAAAGAKPEPNNGRLTARPNEIIVAAFFPVRGETGLEKVKQNRFDRNDAGMLTDIALIEDVEFRGSPVKVEPQLAMTEDERQVPENGKRIGTLAVEDGPALQVPLDELIIYPRDQRQLKQFLAETKGEILLDSSAGDPEAQQGNPPRGYLVRVNAGQADTSRLPQLRSLIGEKETLLASSTEALQIVALATQYRLDGFVVAVNPRLQFMSAPSTRDSSSPLIDAVAPTATSTRVFADDRFGVRRAWAYTALWDADAQRIPVAILDMGFAPNWDFRGFPSGIFQCNLEDRDLGDVLGGRVPCAPGAATGPPTVGNSFFGSPSWHGTGVVTTAAGVLNNGWGSAGTGGQVVEPRLYKTGLRSYAFEMGLGMRKATTDGAAIINVSAGYPCTVVPTVGPDLTFCDTAQRAALCGALTLAVHTAAALICATVGWVPVIGVIACASAHAAAAVSTAACFATLLLRDPRGPLQEGVEFARSQGVTVISIAGNQQSRASLGALCDVIGCGPQDAGRWNVVPGVLPGVICAGAADSAPPYANQHFFGTAVDLWAPIFSTYFHPPTITSVVGPTGQVATLNGFGGTSAAAPYIAGVAAMMQAVNPNLNPRNPALTAAQRAAIPDIIQATLVGTATPASALPPDPSGQRRNLIDAFRAVKAAATLRGRASLPDFDALGYDASLGFDETSASNSFDLPTTGRVVAHTDSARQFHGTILAIPAGPGPGGFNFTDHDWYRVRMPPGPEGLYRRVVRLTQPRRDRFGAILINDRRGRLFASLPGGLEEVWEYEVTGNDGSTADVMLHGTLNSDNVYKVQFLAPERIGARPRPDRFDRPEGNPPERPNNDESERATPLGTGETAWRDATPGDALPGVSISEISVPDLSLHHGGDQDWFTVPLPGGAEPPVCNRCSPTLNITAGPGVTINVYDSRGGAISGPRTSPATLNCNEYRGRGPLRILLTSAGGGPANYNLRVTWTDASGLCNSLGGSFIRGALDASRIVFIIPMDDPPDILYQFDNAGRVTNQALYAVPWRGQGKFVLHARVEQGQSVALQLLDARGKVVAQTASPDLAQQFGVWAKHSVNVESSALTLEAHGLAPGVYFLAVSHMKPHTGMEILIP
jgi:hypothetical protein